MNKSALITTIVAVVFAAAGFYGGMLYGTSKNASTISNFGTRQAGTGMGRNATPSVAGGMVYGEIVSVDSTSMTVKAKDGGSKIVFFSGSTKISKNADAPVSDLVAGLTVMASGTTNSDGSVSAKTVEINPQTRVSSQGGQSGSGSVKTSATQTQNNTASGFDNAGIPPIDDNGAGGPPPGF